jgi:hypothetical protein
MKQFDQTPGSFMIKRIHEKILAFDYEKDIVQDYNSHLLEISKTSQRSEKEIIREIKDKKNNMVSLGDKKYHVRRFK